MTAAGPRRALYVRLYLRKPGATIVDHPRISLKNWRFTKQRLLSHEAVTRDAGSVPAKIFTGPPSRYSRCTSSSRFKFVADIGIRSLTRLIESILSFDRQSWSISRGSCTLPLFSPPFHHGGIVRTFETFCSRLPAREGFDIAAVLAGSRPTA